MRINLNERQVAKSSKTCKELAHRAKLAPLLVRGDQVPAAFLTISRIQKSYVAYELKSELTAGADWTGHSSQRSRTTGSGSAAARA
jgi:hypothetical protein